MSMMGEQSQTVESLVRSWELPGMGGRVSPTNGAKALRPKLPPAWRGLRLPDGPFPMWVFERQTGAILTANACSHQVYGYDAEEWSARTVEQLCPSDGRSKALATMTHEEAATRPGAFRHRCKDGTAFDADTALVELAPSIYGVAATLVVVQPRPARRPMVVEVSHAAIPVQAPPPPPTESVSPRPPAFASKTLLGSAAALATHFEPTASFEVLERLERYAEARVRRNERVTALRSLVESPDALVEVDPRVLAEAVRTKIRARASARGIEIVLTGNADRVRVHPPSFVQALFELCDNALNATRRRVPIVLDVERTPKGDVVWQIKDQGKGMSRYILGGLGQPHETLLRMGAALGVPFAWTVVERHNGLLRFESARSVGTTATVWLPGGP